MEIDKSWYIRPVGISETISAGGVVVRRADEKILVGLVNDPSLNGWILPKGQVEKSESLETTAKREVSEETGLGNLRLVTKLARKERLTREKHKWMIVHYYLFITNQKSGKQNLQEGEEGFVLNWFGLGELPAFIWPEQRELIEENLEKIKKAI
jgi:ADP-ribose pyrophosphatase YjhB (NUDIX family)